MGEFKCPHCGGNSFTVQESLVHSGEVDNGVLNVKLRYNEISLIQCANEQCQADCTIECINHCSINFC